MKPHAILTGPLTRGDGIQIPDVKVSLTINGRDVYESSTQPFRSTSWWLHSLNAAPNGSLSLVVVDEITGELRSVALTVDQILQAFATLVENGFTHCNGYPLQDLDNSDACTSDLVLQQATYGEVIWG